eukprot:907899-Rhodomonas_salina.4
MSQLLSSFGHDAASLRVLMERGGAALLEVLFDAFCCMRCRVLMEDVVLCCVVLCCVALRCVVLCCVSFASRCGALCCAVMCCVVRCVGLNPPPEHGLDRRRRWRRWGSRRGEGNGRNTETEQTSVSWGRTGHRTHN